MVANHGITTTQQGAKFNLRDGRKVLKAAITPRKVRSSWTGTRKLSSSPWMTRRPSWPSCTNENLTLRVWRISLRPRSQLSMQELRRARVSLPRKGDQWVSLTCQLQYRPMPRLTVSLGKNARGCRAMCFNSSGKMRPERS